MSLARFSVRNPVFVNMLMLVILAGGTIFALTLVREMFPEFRPNKLIITAIYPGVQPQEIEKAVTIKIEEAVRDVEGVEKVDSTVSESQSITTLTLYNEVEDAEKVLNEVKREIDSLPDLPDDLERVSITKFEPMLPVISIAIYGDGDEADLKRATHELRDDLLELPGVSRIIVSGVRDDEISVEIIPERLIEYDVTFEEVAEAIRQSNLDVSGGQLKGDRTTIAVRTVGEELEGADLENIVVRSAGSDGKKVLLREVAVVHDGFIDVDIEGYFDSKPAMHCDVYKTKSQDAIQISSVVKAYVAGKKNLPFDPYGYAAAQTVPWYERPFMKAGAAFSEFANLVAGRPDAMEVYERSRQSPFRHGFDVALNTDLARFIEGRLDLMARNGRTGLILVLISLMLFLNWRVAFWAAVGLPVSFLGTFIVMWMCGISINLLSVFGLIIVLGIIVDDAIVIGENICRHVEDGEPSEEAAVTATEEVQWPVIIAVLTTIAAFAPLLFIKGTIGEFMGELPIVVMAALSVSLVEALVILPSHLRKLPGRAEERRRREAAGEAGSIVRRFRRLRAAQERFIVNVLQAKYETFLRAALRWKFVTISIATSTMLISFGLVAGGLVEFVFVQDMDSETVICDIELPVGSPDERVRARVMEISNFVKDAVEVENVQAFVGIQVDVAGEGAVGVKDQSHLGQLVIELQESDARERSGGRSSNELLASFREFTRTLPEINAVRWLALNGGPGGRDIVVKVSGSHLDELVEVTSLIRDEIRGYQGVFDLDDDHDSGKREVQLRLFESARANGGTVAGLGMHVRSALYGREARRITRNREDVRIMVRYPESFRESIYNLESMWIPTGDIIGQRRWIPLRQIAQLTETNGVVSLYRSQNSQAITVYANVDDEQGNTSDILNGVRKSFDEKIQPDHPNVRIEFLGSYEEMRKAFSGLKLAFPVALLLIYMMLAGLFRSYVQPIVVMAAIPFGIQGAIVGHLLTNNPITILSLIGMVALSGILVNDSLVLVDFINSRVRNGVDYFEASIDGARLRLRAILLTTLTTAAGLTPLMFETSFQAKFMIPMAVTLTFGLIFATGLTLVIVPALNLIFMEIRDRFSVDQIIPPIAPTRHSHADGNPVSRETTSVNLTGFPPVRE
ncbi:MAG: efflux RND transporter permease subunit [Planctomycetota bacterium]|nr:efflux RND transporter permease subunit [Planctomycetota bacterium]